MELSPGELACELDDPEWIQCDDCRKWRKRPTAYVQAMRSGPWSCKSSGSGCSCLDSCDECNKSPCECVDGDVWQDTADPDKHFVAFGAKTPADFSHHVKQKPDGSFYVEWDVWCRRCAVHATLDRCKESPRDKEKMLWTGKGNARTLECWLRDHQTCNPAWSHLVMTSLKFTVPSGHRRFKSSKSSHVRASSTTSSDQLQQTSSDAASDLATAADGSWQPSSAGCPSALECQSPSKAEAAASHSQTPSAADSAPQQIVAPLRLSATTATDQQACTQIHSHPLADTPSKAAQDCSGFPRHSHASPPAHLTASARPKPKGTSPTVQVESATGSETELSPLSTQTVATGKHVGSADPLQCSSLQPSTCHLTGGASDISSKPETSARTTSPHLHQSSHKAQAMKVSLPTHSRFYGPGKGHGLNGNSSWAAPSELKAAPRGLNGPLLSHPRKRKTPDISVTASQPQHGASDRGSHRAAPHPAVDPVTADRLKRVKSKAQEEQAVSEMIDCVDLTRSRTQPEEALSPTSSRNSIALMIAKINSSPVDNFISQEQLQLLQGAVDSVDELMTLERHQLTHVLKHVGKMDQFQVIMVRSYLALAVSWPLNLYCI